MSEVTRILSAIEQGDPHAAEQLLPLIYDELRKLAAQKMAQEKAGQTLQATALVHEAYLRLVDVDKVQHCEPNRVSSFSGPRNEPKVNRHRFPRSGYLTDADSRPTLRWRFNMVRIQFATDRDRSEGNYLLATRSIVRRLRGQVFEVAERDLELLNEHQIHFTVLPIPEPTSSHQEVRNPLTVEL